MSQSTKKTSVNSSNANTKHHLSSFYSDCCGATCSVGKVVFGGCIDCAGVSNLEDSPNFGLNLLTVFNDKCSKCGKGSPRLGGHYGPNAFCKCLGKKRMATPEAHRQISAVETPSLSIVEQIAILFDLRSQGAITQEEFKYLKLKLSTGGD